jgi:cardiolipin synthase
VFVAAGVTDALDGAIARMTHTKTTLGSYLDPAADKLLLLSAFISLALVHEVPRWLTVVVITRDVVVVLGYFILFMTTQETMEVRPTVSGKLSTFCQLGSVASVLIRLVFPGSVPPFVEYGFFYAAGLLTTVAGLQYVYRGMVWAQVRGDA